MEQFLPIHVNSGIPVIDVGRASGSGQLQLLADAVRTLFAAGHNELVLNLANCDPGTLPGPCLLEVLDRLAFMLQGRLGHVTLVGTLDRWIQAGARRSFTWAATEEQAICGYKGLPVGPVAPRLSAMLCIHSQA